MWGYTGPIPGPSGVVGEEGRTPGEWGSVLRSGLSGGGSPAWGVVPRPPGATRLSSNRPPPRTRYSVRDSGSVSKGRRAPTSVHVSDTTRCSAVHFLTVDVEGVYRPLSMIRRLPPCSLTKIYRGACVSGPQDPPWDTLRTSPSRPTSRSVTGSHRRYSYPPHSWPTTQGPVHAAPSGPPTVLPSHWFVSDR